MLRSSLGDSHMNQDMVYFPGFILLLLLICSCKSEDKLNHERPLSPGDTLISENGVFALGFFSPVSSNRSLYVGIWFHNISDTDSSRTIVWVANRDRPATTASSPTLAISNSSDLVLSDSDGRTLWLTQNSIPDAGSTTAMLLDTGNLVLRSPNGTFIWQSFDHPTDTILPGMKLSLIHRASVAGRLVAWKGPDDPSTGDFSFGLDPFSRLQLVIWHGTMPYCRISVWNGVSVSGGMYTSGSSSIVYQTIAKTGDDFFLMFTVSDGWPYTRITLDHTGTMKLLSWNNNSSTWTVISERPTGATASMVHAARTATVTSPAPRRHASASRALSLLESTLPVGAGE